MKVKLSKSESEEIFHTILCGAVSMGYINGYGIELGYNREYYNLISNKLKSKMSHGNIPCYEDVLMGILKDGGKLEFNDIECDGEYSKTITINDIYNKLPNVPIEHLQVLLDGTGDVVDEDIVLQYLLYGEVIFG